MRSAVVGVVAIAALSGCARDRPVRNAGAALMYTGLGVAALAGYICAFGATEVVDPDKKDANLRDCRNMALGGAVMFAVGLPFFIYGQDRNSDPESEQARARQARERAWVLIDEAKAAVARGDCKEVVKREPQVRALHLQLYAKYFLELTSPLEPCLVRAAQPSSDPIPAQPSSDPIPPRDRTKDREQAFALLTAAVKAARSGNCATAIKIGDQIRVLDPAVYDAWFVRDEAIKRCLDEASAPAPVAPRATPGAQPAPSLEAPP